MMLLITGVLPNVNGLGPLEFAFVFFYSAVVQQYRRLWRDAPLQDRDLLLPLSLSVSLCSLSSSAD